MANFRQKMLQILATFPPVRKSFVLFFAKLLKCGLWPVGYSSVKILILAFFGTFWLLLGTLSGNSAMVVQTLIDGPCVCHFSLLLFVKLLSIALYLFPICMEWYAVMHSR